MYCILSFTLRFTFYVLRSRLYVIIDFVCGQNNLREQECMHACMYVCMYVLHPPSINAFCSRERE